MPFIFLPALRHHPLSQERLDFRGPLTVSVEFGKADEEGPVLDESLPKSINANVRPLISLMVSFSKIID